jgi:hypothetical protein|tara:strand:+ start:163 stop:282 length:120 start_codon:yes stop_codon:yes gene_type:complete
MAIRVTQRAIAELANVVGGNAIPLTEGDGVIQMHLRVYE